MRQNSYEYRNELKWIFNKENMRIYIFRIENKHLKKLQPFFSLLGPINQNRSKQKIFKFYIFYSICMKFVIGAYIR